MRSRESRVESREPEENSLSSSGVRSMNQPNPSALSSISITLGRLLPSCRTESRSVTPQIVDWCAADIVIVRSGLGPVSVLTTLPPFRGQTKVPKAHPSAVSRLWPHSSASNTPGPHYGHEAVGNRDAKLNAYPKTVGDWLILWSLRSKMCLSPSLQTVFG